MKKLKAHEYEFLEWLEERLKQREVTSYG
jgi:hypothetical protein